MCPGCSYPRVWPQGWLGRRERVRTSKPKFDGYGLLEKFDPDAERAEALGLADLFADIPTLAAGQARVPDFEDKIWAVANGARPTEFNARVRGDSMEDTIKPGEVVKLRRLPGGGLTVGGGGDGRDGPDTSEAPADGRELLGRLKNFSIYAVSIDEGAGFHEYTLKRLVVHRSRSARWSVEWRADNPWCGWGTWGGRPVEPDERFHVLAEVVKLPVRK